MKLALRVLLLACCLGSLPLATAAELNLSTSFDRWNYGFNGSPGERPSAPVFGDPDDTMFDDYDGQFIVGFDTKSAGFPTSVPAGQKLVIHSVTVTATHSTGGFTYDPTFDNYQTSLKASRPLHQADTDAGKPIELWGVGFRGGFTSAGFGPITPGGTVYEEGDIFAYADPTGTGVRNAFAYDPNYGDVSNLVKDGLWDARPWAIGTVAGLAAGASVPQGTPGKSAGATFSFALDLSRPEVLGYITDELSQGGLFFTIASLYQTVQGGSGNPNFFTRDSFDPAKIAPTLSISYDLVPIPEPSSLVLLALGAVVAGCTARMRRRG